MKFLFVTDTHATMKGPSSRTDSYMGAIKEKFAELADVIKKENITAVIHGGDLFDKPVVSLSLTGDIAKIIHDTGVPWYVVPGNHDLFGYNIKSLPQTSLGLLNQAGVISILYRGSGPIVFKAPSGDTIGFEGQEYHMDIDHRSPEMDYWITPNDVLQPEFKSDRKILIPHSMLLDKEYFPEVPYTKTSDLKNIVNHPDLILVGHYHDGYKRHTIYHSDGTKTEVFNPGSMTRDEGSKGNLTRRPQYVIINYQNKDVWSYQSYEIQCAKPGVDIFDRSHITEKQAKDKYLQSFEQKLSDVKLDAVDVRDVLDKMILGDTSIDQEIAETARDRLSEAEQAIDDVAKQMTGYIEKPDNIYISEIHIKGFQSHEDSVIQLSGGFNAIIGPSDSGKSSIIRALRFALYNEPKGSEFIRQGAQSCEVEVRFSDGGTIRRARTSQSAGTYDVTDPSGQTISLKGFSNNVPVDVPNQHQMPYIQLTKDLECSLNIGFQLDTPFLIGESPGTRAAIIGRLTGVNLVDTAVREIGKEILGNTRDVKTINQQIESTETLIDGFSHLPELEQKIQAASKQISSLDLAERMRQELVDVESRWTGAIHVESDITDELKQLEGIQELAPLVSQLETQLSDLHYLEELEAIYYDVIEEESRYGGEHQDAIDVLSALSFLSELEKQVQESNGLKALRSDILTVIEEKENLWDEHCQLLNASKLNARILQIELEIKALSGFLKLQSELQKNRLNSNELRKEIRLAYFTEGEAMKKHAQLLEENGTCPTCQQTIQRGHTHAN